jgi:hypothetical protein
VSERETTLGEDVEGGVPGYGRTIDEAIQDAYERGKGFGAKPGWFAVEKVFVYVENPIREYKVVVSEGGGS